MTLPFPVGHDALWRRHARCAGPMRLVLLGLWAEVPFDLELWFTEKGGPAYEAKRVCASCPVRVDCLQAALLDGEEFGIWGGAGDGIRRSLARLLKASPHPERVIVADDCVCAFHRGLALHLERLRHLGRTGRTPEGRINFNGPNITHGRRSSYARGCRCALCREAVRSRPRAS